jgi:hypothetical protein
MKRATNHTMQPMGASRLAQPQYGSPQRLAPTADGGRSPTKCMRSLLLMVSVALVVAGCRTEGDPSSSTSSPEQMDASGSGRGPVIALPISTTDAPPTRPYIYISREVKRPGPYTWSRGMTLTDAVNSAGGFTEFAGLSRIRVLHKDHSIAGVYDYERILKRKTRDPVLEPGDYISVTGSLD